MSKKISEWLDQAWGPRSQKETQARAVVATVFGPEYQQNLHRFGPPEPGKRNRRKGNPRLNAVVVDSL